MDNELTLWEKARLYRIAWQGKNLPKKKLIPAKIIDRLLELGLIARTTEDILEATEEGRKALSQQALIACQRPQNYFQLCGDAQWEIDKELGILDWDGS